MNCTRYIWKSKSWMGKEISRRCNVKSRLNCPENHIMAVPLYVMYLREMSSFLQRLKDKIQCKFSTMFFNYSCKFCTLKENYGFSKGWDSKDSCFWRFPESRASKIKVRLAFPIFPNMFDQIWVVHVPLYLGLCIHIHIMYSGPLSCSQPWGMIKMAI